MARKQLLDPVAVRCFINTMLGHAGTPRFNKNGSVSDLSWIDIDGTLYGEFLKVYANLRQNKPEWPDLPPVFEYIPVNFADVRNHFTITNAPHLKTLEGCPATVPEFCLQGVPLLTDLQHSPSASRCSLEKVGIKSLVGLSGVELLTITDCDIQKIDVLPETLLSLSVCKCPQLETICSLSQVSRLEVRAAPKLQIPWHTMSALQLLYVDSPLNSPDKDTLRRWLTTTFTFTPTYPETPVTFDPVAGLIPIPGHTVDPDAMPLWQRLLRLTSSPDVDYIRLYAGFEELYGEPLLKECVSVAAPQEIAVDSL